MFVGSIPIASTRNRRSGGLRSHVTAVDKPRCQRFVNWEGYVADDLDIDLALGQVQAFRDELAASRSIYERSTAGFHSFVVSTPQGTRQVSVYDSDEWNAAEGAINRRLPLIARIAGTLNPVLGEKMHGTARYGWPHQPKVAAVDELIGTLETNAEAETIFAPKGPKLAARDLHSWVWNAAVDLWSDGHYREAVQRAATALFDSHLPAKLEIVGKPGELVSIAFSADPPQPGKPRLRIPGYVEGSESWKNVHEGARFIGMGCVQAVRNLATHELDHDEQRALEQLACLSVLARWVAEADLKTA
jgi:hypothetical protein